METYGLEQLGIVNTAAVYRNLTPAQLTEHALRRGEGTLSATGALVVKTGKYTGRSANDKFIVDTPAVHGDIAWGKDKPRYLMGVGTPSNIIEGVARGVDFFDCVMPARNARHGKLFTWQGSLNIKNAKYKLDDRPIDPACDCPVCRRFSRAYLRHLFTAEEMLGMRLAVMHNLYFYNKLTRRIRESLDAGCFADFRAEYSQKLGEKL